MPNIVEKLSLNYSPNFDLPKRNKKNIRYIIFHYTGMKNDGLAINKLINPKSKVSCHYYIDKNGKIIQMVPDLSFFHCDFPACQAIYKSGTI